MTPAARMLPERDVGGGVMVVRIDPKLVDIAIEPVLEELGYTNRDVDQYFIDLVRGLINLLPEKLAVHAAYRVVPKRHTATADSIELGDGMSLQTGTIVTSQLRGTTETALFACTIGAGMEEVISGYMAKGEIVEGHFADVTASLAAEKVTSLLHGHITAVMQTHNAGVTNRFSPGYCGWSVAEQQKLFTLLPARLCGITLSSSSLMAPAKSVSGIIGVGNDVTWKPYLCTTCTRKNCTYRTYRREREKTALRL